MQGSIKTSAMSSQFLKRAFFLGARYSGANWLLRHLFGNNRLLILCYHGVVSGDHPADTFAYRNTVSVRAFRQQIQFIARHFHPLSVADLLEYHKKGTSVPPQSVLVTFDDGYRNNWTLAAPVLTEYGVSAMFAVTTDYVGRTDVLWPDELNLRVLGWPEATIPYPSNEVESATMALPLQEPARIQMADKIRNACKRIPETARLAYLNKLRELPSTFMDERDRELYDFLTWDEVRSLASAGFNIASHTVSHPIMTQIDKEHLDRELTESKCRIETEIRESCMCFVYPNGDYSPEVEAATKRAGYVFGFGLTGSFASLRDDDFALSRIIVPGHPSQPVFESRASGLYTLLKQFR